MNEEILVSILCTAYNHEPYIRQCLDGFVMQKTNFKFEAIMNGDIDELVDALVTADTAQKLQAAEG